MKLPVYSRADLSRTVALVVALSLTAVPTSAVAREFRAADTRNMIKALGAEPIELPYGQERSRRQAEAADVTIVTDFDRKPFEAAMAGIYAKAQRDPAAAELIQRIRKVE
jgi:TRAP-type C4-dicarboxylate transport system substrate-binding protein